MAKDKKHDHRLVELGRSDFELADDEQNIRGWEVKNNRGITIGKVAEFLFDPLSRSVRYLVIDIDGKPINLLSRKVVIPTGVADIHETEDVVVLRNVEVGHLAALPTYKRDEVTPAFERYTRNILTGNALAPAPNGDLEDEHFYEHDHFKDDHLYQRRRHRAKGDTPVIDETVHSGSHIIERSKRKESFHDHGEVEEKRNRERREAEASSHRDHRKDSLAPFEEGQIEFVEHKEVPVVTKTAKVVEEIDIHKDVSHREETVQDTVRRREVDIDDLEDKRKSAD